MAPTLRRAAARSSYVRSSYVRSSFVSHLGMPHGDRSFLLVRERPQKASPTEHFALHGAFDQAVSERLYPALRDLSRSALPLVLDLRGVSALDEAFLARLLKVQRELSTHRPVSFQVAADGPVFALICRLGLEERFGLMPAKRLPLKRVPAFAVSRTDPEKTSARDLIAS